MSRPMMMLVSSSDAVRKIIGTFDVRRTLWQNSKPEPSGRDTSSTKRSYFPSAHSASASLSVLALSASKPCFLKAKESPVIRLRSSSKSKILLMLIPRANSLRVHYIHPPRLWQAAGESYTRRKRQKALRDTPRRALKCTVMSYVLSFLLAEDALAGFAVKVAH